jgi:hypothetical protein
VNFICRFIFLLTLVASITNVSAQTYNVMMQKIAFQKSAVTIDEVLKGIIRSKKVNLSYSPDALNLKEIIRLPAKEVSIGELLNLISNKTGNRVVIHGNQVVIKKVKEKPEIVKAERLPEPAMNSVLPKDTLFLKQNITKPDVAKLLPLKVNDQLKLLPKQISRPELGKSKSIVLKAETKKEEIPKPKPRSRSKSPYTLYIGSSLEMAQLNGVKLSTIKLSVIDTIKNIKSPFTVGWGLQAIWTQRLNKRWQVETGVGFRQSGYSFKWTFLTSGFKAIQNDSGVYYRFLHSESKPVVKLQVNTILVPLYIDYNFNQGKSKLIIGAGVNARYSLSGKGKYTTDSKKTEGSIHWSAPSDTLTVPFFCLNRMNYAVSGKVAWRYQNWELSADASFGINQFTKENSGKPLQLSLALDYMILPKRKYLTR